VVRRCNKTELPEFLQHHQDIIMILMEGFEDEQLTQHVGSILQEMAKRTEIGPMMFDVPLSFKKSSSTIVFKPSLAIKSSSLYIEREKLVKSFGVEEMKGDTGVKSLLEISPPLATVVKEQKENEKNDAYVQVVTQTHDMLETTLTANDVITQLFVYSHNPNLIVSSDAFEVLNLLFSKHEVRTRRYIEDHYDRMMEFFNGSVMSENYVIQGKFLKLLADVLLSKQNSKIRMLYISNKINLRIIMTLLKSSSRLISHESFQIFKVFVANPHKTEKVHIVLFKNQKKLVKLLEEFQTQREETDPEFKREKYIVLDYLKTMEMPPNLSSRLQRLASHEDTSPQISDDNSPQNGDK